MRLAPLLALVLLACGAKDTDPTDSGTTTGTTGTTGTSTTASGTPAGTAAGSTTTGTPTTAAFDAAALEGRWLAADVQSTGLDECEAAGETLDFVIGNASGDSFTLDLDGAPTPLNCSVVGQAWSCIPNPFQESAGGAQFTLTWTLGGLEPANDTMDMQFVFVGECAGAPCDLMLPTNPCTSNLVGEAIRQP